MTKPIKTKKKLSQSKKSNNDYTVEGGGGFAENLAIKAASAAKRAAEMTPYGKIASKVLSVAEKSPIGKMSKEAAVNKFNEFKKAGLNSIENAGTKKPGLLNVLKTGLKDPQNFAKTAIQYTKDSGLLDKAANFAIKQGVDPTLINEFKNKSADELKEFATGIMKSPNGPGSFIQNPTNNPAVNANNQSVSNLLPSILSNPSSAVALSTASASAPAIISSSAPSTLSSVQLPVSDLEMATNQAELEKLEDEIAEIANALASSTDQNIIDNFRNKLTSPQTGGGNEVILKNLDILQRKLEKILNDATDTKIITATENDLKNVKRLQKIAQGVTTIKSISQMRTTLNEILTDAASRDNITVITQVKNNLNKLDVIEKQLNNKSHSSTTDSDDVTLDPIAMETQKKQDVQKLLVVFLIITGFFKKIYFAFKNSSNGAAIFTILAFVLVISSMILSIVYLVKLLTDYSNGLLISNPLNIQSFGYNVSKSLGFFGTKYKYILFIILPVFAFIFSLGAVFYTSGVYKIFRITIPPVPTQGLVTGIAIACLIQSTFSIIVNASTYGYTQKHLNIVNDRIKTLNNFIHNKLYKNANFLNTLKEIPTNSLLVNQVVQNALLKLDKNASVNDIASAFFTLNLFYHYQKIGYRSEFIEDATKLFDIRYLLTSSSLSKSIISTNLFNPIIWSPTDYLFNKATFIKDYSNEMQKMYSAKSTNTELTRKIMMASNKTAMWLEEINTRANTIYPNDNKGKFITMAIVITIFQTLPLLILMYVFQKERVREAFIEFLKTLFKPTLNT